MVKDVIVTIVVKNRSFDVEIPAQVPISIIKPNIIDAFRKKGINLDTGFRLVFNGSGLPESDTLLDHGVWDGSILTII